MTLVRTLEHDSNVWCSSFANGGSILITCAADDSLSIWNLKSGTKLRKLSISMIRGCHVCPDSSLIAVCFRKQNILVYRLSDLKPAIDLHGHTDGVVYCQFSPSGGLLASCGWDRRTCIWDVASTQLCQKVGGHTSPVVECSFAANEGYLATASWDATIAIHDLRVRGSPLILRGHTGAIYGVTCCPSDSTLVASCSVDGTVVFWDMRTAGPLHCLCIKNEVNCVEFSPSGALLAVGSDYPEIQLWNVVSPFELLVSVTCISPAGLEGLQLTQPLTLYGHADGVYQCCYSPDGCHLATCSSDHTCRLWDLSQPPEAAVSQLADTFAGSLSLHKEDMECS